MDCVYARRFDVAVRRGLASDQPRELSTWIGNRRMLLITTPTVYRLYGEALYRKLLELGVDVTVHVAQLSERNKTLSTVANICDVAAVAGLGRRDVFAALGGGVCCDVVSVAASLYRRGVPYVTIPSTLIGQIDAGVGIKGAVNANGRKNELGCYWPPEAVFVDPSLLRSLSRRHLRSGSAELAKIAIIADPALFEDLYEHAELLLDSGYSEPQRRADALIERAIELILAELEPNCFEDQSYERSLDLGHTFSPRLEERTHYALLHGEAVAIDIALSCRIGTELGWLDPNDSRRILSLLLRLGLPIDHVQLDHRLVRDAIDVTTRHRAGHLNLPIPSSIGSIRILQDAGAIGTEKICAILPRTRPRRERSRLRRVPRELHKSERNS
jgi:3-dehydroquinate synthase